MAKKTKKVTSKKVAPKTTPRKSAKKKTVAKKVTKKTARGKTATTDSLSVDGVLQKYEKERVTKQSQLDSLRKKIDDLKAKTIAYQEQIKKLSKQQVDTTDDLDHLDSRRDQEIRALLKKLGVQLGGASTAAEPVANKAEAAENGSGKDEESAAKKQPSKKTEGDLKDGKSNDTNPPTDASNGALAGSDNN